MSTPAVRLSPRLPASGQPWLIAPLSRPAAGLGFEQLRERLPVARRKVSARHYLYRAGQPFAGVFLVHAGFFKTCLVADDGGERVTGFRMRGDLLGVEAIGMTEHVCDVVALDAGEVWELPNPPLLGAAQRYPELQAMLTAALAAEIRHERTWMLALGTLGAEQRVATFLLDLAARYQALGYSASEFVLRMTRAEIGSFLSLQLETVTRAMSHLHALGLIEVRRREVILRDPQALRALIATAA
jgi:CRP/FNR family transcriptional regulator